MADKTALQLVGGPGLIKSYPEAASQTFLKGEAVYIDGNGRVAEFTAALDDGTQRFLGFAADDGANDTIAGNSKVSVYVGPDNEFEANITSNGSDQITAITQVGTKYPLYQDTVNSIIMVDIADTGSQIDCIRVIKVDERKSAGETNGRVRFHLTRDALQVFGD